MYESLLGLSRSCFIHLLCKNLLKTFRRRSNFNLQPYVRGGFFFAVSNTSMIHIEALIEVHGCHHVGTGFLSSRLISTLMLSTGYQDSAQT